MTSISDDEPRLTTREAAARLRMTEGGLRWWRHVGRGPRSYKSGRKTLYRLSSIVAWERAQEEATTRGEIPESRQAS
jgi:hypothetical protein